MSIEHVVVEADGGSRGNPGPAGYGAVVLDPTTGEVLAERSESIGVETNNVAEYSGLIAGLQAAAELGAGRVSVRMDSKLVVEQMSGRWQVKHPSMRPLAREAAALRARFDEVTFEWIPRERNKHADRLANEAMDRAAGKTPRATRAAGPAARPPVAAGTGSAPAEPASARPERWVRAADDAPVRLVLVRHGATRHSAARRFSGRNDLALTEYGVAQAEGLARRVPELGGIAAVVSSPLVRARETATAIAAPLGLPVEIANDLTEVDFGAWEGLTFAEARQGYPAELDAWLASVEQAPPGGESFASAARRVRHGRDALLAAGAGRTVVAVTHVTPIKILLSLALDAFPIGLFRIHLDTASISIVDYFADGNASVRLVNDTGHVPPEPIAD